MNPQCERCGSFQIVKETRNVVPFIRRVTRCLCCDYEYSETLGLIQEADDEFDLMEIF